MCLSCSRGPWALPAALGGTLGGSWPWACWGTPQAPPGPSRARPAASAEALFVWFQSEDLDFWLSTTPPPAAAPALSTVRAGGRAPCAGPTPSAAGHSCLREECRDTPGSCPQWPFPFITYQTFPATQAPGVGGYQGTLTQMSQVGASSRALGLAQAATERLALAAEPGSSREQSRHRSRWAWPLWALGSPGHLHFLLADTTCGMQEEARGLSEGVPAD